MVIGEAVLVPLINPASALGLIRLAALLAKADGGRVVPVTVVGSHSDDSALEAGRELILRAEAISQALGVPAQGVVAIDDAVATGVLDAADEQQATLALIGWRGQSTNQNVFGQLIDSIVGRSSIPLAIVRQSDRPIRRLLLPVSDDHLLPSGNRGVELAADLVSRLHDGTQAPVMVLRTGEARQPLPASVVALSDRVHHDTRRVDAAVNAAATSDDCIVVPVAPTISGLRTATTHVAWAAPDAAIIVAVDVGPPPQRSLAPAVRRAGQPRPPAVPAGSGEVADHALQSPVHTVVVTVGFTEAADAPSGAVPLGVLAELLGRLGVVTRAEARGGELVVTVGVAAADSHTALSTVMIALHESPLVQGAEIRYELAG